MAGLDMRKLIQHFAQSNRAEGKSPKTVEWYTEMLLPFAEFLGSSSPGTTLAEFDVEAVREFIIHEQERGLSPYTVQGKVRALKAFSSWLLAEGYTLENRLASMRSPKVPSTIIEPLADDEIEKLVAAQNPLTAIGCRNIAILMTFLDTGIRQSGLSNLRLEDAHVEEGWLKVIEKGSKERVVPIGAVGQKVVWRYVFHFRPEPESDLHDYLFLTLDGKKLEPNAIKLLMKRWGKRAGVPRLHAHLCRHTFATNFLIHGCGDVFRLQQILGHTTLEMVRRYVHYAEAEAMIQGRVASPLDRMGLKGLRSYRIDRGLRGNGA
jgi:integrase/recombinase XerC/integrase/recombinase XerD